MNEFVAKKLGEVLGFSRLGIEGADRSGEFFAQAVGEGSQLFVEEFKSLAVKVEQKGNEVTMAKADATVQKLRGMMEAYIGDQWQNPTEILEWLSFFSGAAGAHWSLVKGAAATLEDSDLKQTAEEAMQSYNQLLTIVGQQLYLVGQQKSGQ